MMVNISPHNLSTSPQGKNPWYFLDRMVTGPHNQLWWQRKNSSLCQELNCNQPACSFFTTLDELTWLSSAVYQHKITYCNATHFPPLIIHARYICAYLLLQNFFFVVLFNDFQYLLDCLFMCTEHIRVMND
jgi:hypothetical protein